MLDHASETPTEVGTAAIATDGVSAGYGVVPVIREVSLQVMPGEVVALLGPNGAGKTTILLTMAGELTPMSGRVLWRGEPFVGQLHQRARAGLRLITEDRSVFMSLSVADNLRLAHRDYGDCLDIFPELKPLLKRPVGFLSGGEQQMLSLARAIVGECKVLLADELSLGLAPQAVERLFAALRIAAERGTAVLLVEQQLDRALSVADRAYTLVRGRVTMSGTVAEIEARRAEVEASYLSIEDDSQE